MNLTQLVCTTCQNNNNSIKSANKWRKFQIIFRSYFTPITVGLLRLGVTPSCLRIRLLRRWSLLPILGLRIPSAFRILAGSWRVYLRLSPLILPLMSISIGMLSMAIISPFLPIMMGSFINLSLTTPSLWTAITLIK